MIYRILTTAEFDKLFSKLSTQEQTEIQKILAHLCENGGDVGKPLSGLSFFREKKFGGKRLYYLVYRDVLVILVISISDKKAQHATINRILLDIVEYQKYVFELIYRNK